MPWRSFRKPTILRPGVRGDQLSHRGVLAGSDLEDEITARRQARRGCRNQPPDHVESVRSGKQRFRRLIVADFRLQPSPVSLRDVGRIGHDEIEALDGRPEPLGQQVAVDEHDAALDAMPARVLLRDLKPGCGDVGRQYAGGGTLLRQRDRRDSRFPCRYPRSRAAASTSGNSCRAASTMISVSGRGMSTAGVTSNMRP